MEKVKKIAVLLPSMQVGGAECLVLEELAFMKDDPRFAFEVHLVFEKGPFFNKLLELQIPVRIWNAPHKSVRMIKTYWDIGIYLRRTSCDILHCHLLNNLGPLMGMLAGIPTVTTIHADIVFGRLTRFWTTRSSLVLGCGEKVGQNISRFVRHSKVGVINNAVRFRHHKHLDEEIFMERLGISSCSLLMLSLGRLTKQKGYDVLIYAIKQVVEKVPGIVLVIGGEGEDELILLKLIRDLALDNHVKLLGIIQDTDEYFKHCHVYINSSRWEGLPMTLLEAMSYSKPIIATNVGGNADVVRNGKTGILVESEDIDALARAILTLVNDKTLREKIGSNAHELFMNGYSIEKHCEKLAKYYIGL